MPVLALVLICSAAVYTSHPLFSSFLKPAWLWHFHLTLDDSGRASPLLPAAASPHASGSSVADGRAMGLVGNSLALGLPPPLGNLECLSFRSLI